MMKRVLLSLLALSLCVMLAVPVFAAPRNGVYILDELEHLDDDDFRSLHQEAIRVSEALGLDVILVFTYEENLEAYGQQLTIGQIDDQIIMLDNEEDWAIVCHGAAVKMTTSSDWPGRPPPGPLGPEGLTVGLVLAGGQLPQPAAPWPERTPRFCPRPCRPGCCACWSAG